MDLLKQLGKAAAQRHITIQLKAQPHGEIRLIRACGKTTTVQFHQPSHKRHAISRAIELLQAMA